jgi:DNA repair protein RecN (Recombination protein N)
MLAELSIRNIVLIERLDLAPGRGLVVFTGETGAGKSILLDALGLALGARGDAALVRAGAEQGVVSARFELPVDHPVFALLEEEGIGAGEEPGELILRRVQKAAGASRASINGEPVAVSLLRRVGEMLVEIHGQHDARALMDPSRHGDLLDAYGGLQAQAAEVARLWQDWRAARQRLEERRQALMAAEREREWLEHAVEELSTLAPEADEEERLAARRQMMMNAERFADAISAMQKALSGPDGAVAGRINAALRRLERQREAAAGRLDDVCEAFDRVLVELAEAERLLEEAAARFEHDPRELEEVEQRLFALRAAARKHRVPVAELPALLADLEDQLAALRQGADDLKRLEARAAAARAAYLEAARALSAARREAAARLDVAVAAELAPLRLERARFETRVETDEAHAGPAGIDRVEFMVATNPGTLPGPLAKIASGGELSRFMLALKAALAARGSAPVLVFDEIDTGVGGAVAAAMGERLKRLADSGLQVLAVTHSPQVAARADHHHVIAKEVVSGADGEVARTRVRTLGAAERREEIARMLSAHEITAEARAQAARLLADAEAGGTAAGGGGAG